MPKYIYLFILLVLFSGCNDDDDSQEPFDIKSFPQTWVLDQMTIGLSGQVLTENELPYQETIALQNDKRFVKTRDSEGTITVGEGSFSFITSEAGIVLNMIYDSDTNLISSCSGEKNIERFNVSSSSSISGGSSPCDGPALFYIRIE